MTTAAERRFTLPIGCSTCETRLSSSYFVVASLCSLIGVPDAVVLVPLAATIGADAGCGGVFESAPGTPEAPPCADSLERLVCWLRMAACCGLPFGPYD